MAHPVSEVGLPNLESMAPPSLEATNRLIQRILDDTYDRTRPSVAIPVFVDKKRNKMVEIYVEASKTLYDEWDRSLPQKPAKAQLSADGVDVAKLSWAPIGLHFKELNYAELDLLNLKIQAASSSKLNANLTDSDLALYAKLRSMYNTYNFIIYLYTIFDFRLPDDLERVQTVFPSLIDTIKSSIAHDGDNRRMFLKQKHLAPQTAEDYMLDYMLLKKSDLFGVIPDKNWNGDWTSSSDLDGKQVNRHEMYTENPLVREKGTDQVKKNDPTYWAKMLKG